MIGYRKGFVDQDQQYKGIR